MAVCTTDTLICVCVCVLLCLQKRYAVQSEASLLGESFYCVCYCLSDPVGGTAAVFCHQASERLAGRRCEGTVEAKSNLQASKIPSSGTLFSL